jgi:Uma2 family endonuclease
MSKSPHPGNIFLENVPWQDLETILFKRQKNGETLLAYDHGRLELITPSPLHQEYRELLEEFLIALLDLYNINYRGLGVALWQRRDLQLSLEVDSCFYVQNLPAIEKLLTINLPENPPPDLVLEIDLTHKSLSRRSLYARLGIPEVWRCDENKLKIYQLSGGDYEQVPRSLVFPEIALERLPQIIKNNIKSGRATVRREFQKWLMTV